jgi:CDP-diacylglycerol--glycerol-3-phosphate 3-phosphatidyltransferase
MLQIVAISLYVLPWHVVVLQESVMGVALAVTVVTGADYTARAIRLRRAVQ